MGKDKKWKAPIGARNLITDLEGVLVGNSEDKSVATGVTALFLPERGVAACDMRGGAPGTRETDALESTCLVDAVDAVFLSGGSSYGLEAGSAITAWLGARGRGYSLIDGLPPSPIVPGAILFDMANGGEKSWGETPPFAALGRQACEEAGRDFPLGNVGAGYGASCGRLKGGLGSASYVSPDGLEVGALVAVNAFGSAISPKTGRLWAEAAALQGEMGSHVKESLDDDIYAGTKAEGFMPGANTTIGIVAVNAKITVPEAKRIAMMAQDGLARGLRPVHSPMDGDTIFVVSTGRWDMGEEARALSLTRLGTLAADCVLRAIGRGVYEAESLNHIPSYRERLQE